MGRLTDISPGERFDLSQNKSLRGLKISMFDIQQAAKGSPFAKAPILEHALSTIKSPTFSTVTVTYKDIDFPPTICDSPAPPHILSLVGLGMALKHRIAFKLLREMREIRNFKLVLCAHVDAPLAERATRELEWAIETQWVPEGGADKFSSRPSVTCIPQAFLPAPGEVLIDSSRVPLEYPWAPGRL